MGSLVNGQRWRAAVSAAGLAMGMAFGQQMADPRFDSGVANPAYVSEHPKVAIDEAHHNFHTAEGRYKPFAELLRHDGYKVVRGRQHFSADGLKGIRVLAIANALGAGATAGTDTSTPAFTEQECVAVREWVRGGGALLLISDHTPFGMASENLAGALGVQLGKGFVFAPDAKYSRKGEPTTLIFSRENELLGDHPITRGRSDSERIRTVMAFTGESVGIPPGATALMKLAPIAREAASRSELRAALEDLNEKNNASGQHSTAAHGAQGIAMTFGKGRVVVLGEAAMMSAQVIHRPPREDIPMGMNAPGSDDRQFALNVLHWLSGLLK